MNRLYSAIVELANTHQFSAVNVQREFDNSTDKEKSDLFKNIDDTGRNQLQALGFTGPANEVKPARKAATKKVAAKTSKKK